MTNQEKLCYNFMHRKCNKKNCQYLHDSTICFYHWKDNTCNYGSECRKRHLDNIKSPDANGNGNANGGKHIRSVTKNESGSTVNNKPADMRIVHAKETDKQRYSNIITSRDIIVAPNIFSQYASREIFEKLLIEIRENDLELDETLDPTDLSTPILSNVIERVCLFFNMTPKSIRINHSTQDTPHRFHKYSAVVKGNFTVVVSFGAARDITFENTATKTIVSLSQTDGCVYAFSKDTNILWRQGILHNVPVKEEGRVIINICGRLEEMEEIPIEL